MFRTLTAGALVIAATAAAEPVRDPFAPAATPAQPSATAAVAASPPADEPMPALALEGLAKAGKETIAIIRVGTRRILVTAEKEFACGQHIMRLVSVGDGEVLLRDQRDAAYPLGIAIQPAESHQAPPAAAAPAIGPEER